MDEELKGVVENIYNMCCDKVLGEGSIPPVFLMYSKGELSLVQTPYWETPEQKETVFDRMNKMTRKMDPDVLIFVSETWVVERPLDYKGGLPIPSECDDRYSAVSIVITEADGKGYLLQAKITETQTGNFVNQDSKNWVEDAQSKFSAWRGPMSQPGGNA